jgi:hypothetical protein
VSNKKTNFSFDTIKQVLSLKKTKLTLYMVAVLWLAVGTQMVVNKVFREDVKITEAFVKTNAEEMQSSIEIVAEYHKDFLSEIDKKTLIKKIADAIGLKVDDDISVKTEDNRTEYSFYKHAKQATSEIKVVSLEQEKDSVKEMKHYLIVRLNILQSIRSIDKYKNILENTMTKLGVENQQITMSFEGNQEGNITSKEKNQIATQLVKELQGEVAMEYDEGDLYTVYAYTGLIHEYIETVGCKINIQISITYNELTNKTRITLATPIMNINW